MIIDLEAYKEQTQAVLDAFMDVSIEALERRGGIERIGTYLGITAIAAAHTELISLVDSEANLKLEDQQFNRALLFVTVREIYDKVKSAGELRYHDPRPTDVAAEDLIYQTSRDGDIDLNLSKVTARGWSWLRYRY